MTSREACQEFESLLARAADGALNEADHGRLDLHLAGCDGCRRALADQRAVRDALQSRPVLRDRPEFAVAVMAAIEAERSWLERLDFRRWTWRLAPVAAALSLIAWAAVQAGSSDAAGAAFDENLPVSAALWQDSVSDVSVLSLMLRAGADDRLADSYKE